MTKIDAEKNLEYQYTDMVVGLLHQQADEDLETMLLLVDVVIGLATLNKQTRIESRAHELKARLLERKAVTEQGKTR